MLALTYQAAAASYFSIFPIASTNACRESHALTAEPLSWARKHDETISRPTLKTGQICPGRVSCCEMSTILTIGNWQPKPMASLV